LTQNSHLPHALTWSYWDRERANAFGRSERSTPKAQQAFVHAINAAEAQSSRKEEASVTTDHQFDPTTNRLTKVDIVLAKRSTQNGLGNRYDDDFESNIAARATVLVKSGQSRALGSRIAFDAGNWQKLHDIEINAAAREQMGLNRGAIQTQLSVSEGKVLGHIETSLDRHAVIDRGVNAVAVREISGSELNIGQILGAGLSR
jgi:hypothetical protein